MKLTIENTYAIKKLFLFEKLFRLIVMTDGNKKAKIFKIKQEKNWTKEEDELICEEAKKVRKNWKELSKKMIRKSTKECIERYKSICFKKGRWTPEEDKKLIKLNKYYGPNWGLISKKMKSRNWKQIRDRWVNKLDPSLIEQSFSIDEDLKIYQLHSLLGNRWKLYSSFLPGRSPDKIKSRFHSSIKDRHAQIKFLRFFSKLVGEQ
jgi:hypothetical protein